MKYPTLTHSKCVHLASQLLAGEDPSIEPHVLWVGYGDEIDLQPIAEAASSIIHNAREWTERDRDRFEGKASARLLSALAAIPIEILDDRGFWRFLSCRYFWEFIAWREEGPFATGNHLKYVIAATNTESVLPRMYLRAKASGGDASVASAVPQAADFWRSHIVRVRTGSAPKLARAFAEIQAEDRLMTDDLRQSASHLNRVWTNIVLYLYEYDEASALIRTIWDGVDE